MEKALDPPPRLLFAHWPEGHLGWSIARAENSGPARSEFRSGRA
jgi:hypothetical protein